MKAMLLLLCQTLVAGEFRLIQEAGRLVAEGVQGGVQLFTSSNLKEWFLEREFTGSTSSAISRPFARAIAKPSPPAVTIERIDASGTKATIYAKTSAHTISARCGVEVEGQVVRHEFSPKGITGTSWKIGPWNPASSNVTCSFQDPYGQTVSTNLTITFRGFKNPITVEYPLQGMSVVGDNLIVFGDIDRVNSTVWIEANQSSWPCVAVNGSFVSPKIPIKASNLWKVRCVNDRGENVSMDLAFSQSPVTITYSIANLTRTYGPCGLSLSGGISDWNYDLMIGDKLVVTTNGYWRVMIPPPVNGVIPFSVLPKQPGNQSSSVSGGTIEFDSPPFVYTYAMNESRSYKSTNANYTVLMNFVGWDRTNRLWIRKRDGGRDCTCEFIGLGTKAFLQPEDNQCGCADSRCLYPTLSLSAYEDISLVDELRNQSSSGCLLNVGGRPGDTRKYLITLGIVLMRMTTRFYDECWFEEVPVSYDWQIGGKPNGLQFVASSCQQFETTVTMPLFESGWYIYDIGMTKTVIPE